MARETSDIYPVVARLNEDWRIVEAEGGTAWLLQRRDNVRNGRTHWKTRHECELKGTLVRRIREYVGKVTDDAEKKIDALPHHIRRSRSEHDPRYPKKPSHIPETGARCPKCGNRCSKRDGRPYCRRHGPFPDRGGGA